MLEMVKKHLDRDTRTRKAGCSAHAVGVDPNDLTELGPLFHRHAFNIRETGIKRKQKTGKGLPYPAFNQQAVRAPDSDGAQGASCVALSSAEHAQNSA